MTTYKKGDEYLRIEIDSDPMSPREHDNLGVIAIWHPRYQLGDLQPKEDPKSFIEDLPEGTVVLPIYMYDHSGVTLRVTPFTCPWDSGQVGIIYATPEQVEAMGTPQDRISEGLVAELEEYGEYVEGNVYGFTRFTKSSCSACGAVEEVDSDSCWGFYGDDHQASGLLEAAGIESLEDWREL